MNLEVRAIALDELDSMMDVDGRGFGAPPQGPDQSRSWAEGEIERTRCAFEGSQLVGASRAYSFDLTLPGGATLPAAAVSWVAVLPTHRRRGVLTKMIDALHHDARERGEPVAILTASESSIYGRFGYGIAAWRLGLTSQRAHIKFRDDGIGNVRIVARDEGEKVLPEIYDRMRVLRAGMVSRPDFWWPTVFWDQFAGGNNKAFFVAVHSDASGNDDGYVAYEISGEWHSGIPDRRLLVWDFQAVDDAVRGELWRYLYGVDLIGTVAATNVPIDDPLRLLVTDPRRVRIEFVNDGLWVAPLDPARFLSARQYARPGRLVFEIHEPDGSTRVVALDDGACASSTDEPDIVCDTATLGACALGGNRWSAVAAAGLARARSAEVLQRADLMFMSTPEPALLSAF